MDCHNASSLFVELPLKGAIEEKISWRPTRSQPLVDIAKILRAKEENGAKEIEMRHGMRAPKVFAT